MSLIPECFWPDINRNKKYNSSVFCSLHIKSESNKVRQNAWMWMVEEVPVFWVALSICLKTQFSTGCRVNLRIRRNVSVSVSSCDCLHKNVFFSDYYNKSHYNVMIIYSIIKMSINCLNSKCSILKLSLTPCTLKVTDRPLTIPIYFLSLPLQKKGISKYLYIVRKQIIKACKYIRISPESMA